ncbi:unnamed protein product [Didymodactylos carnosus]|uniref:Uncharacterized protein n=1 Tax=Didymodactylos carnosus TaxID=1234261 RepID=A0A8S2IE35_9BILA|nr:unnamed protein product [Didymodactylos carnosus]CAF3745132.1 unnamed protein product [Didymodactylos carnosus]
MLSLSLLLVQVIDHIDQLLSNKGWPLFITPCTKPEFQNKLVILYESEDGKNGDCIREFVPQNSKSKFILQIENGLKTLTVKGEFKKNRQKRQQEKQEGQRTRLILSRRQFVCLILKEFSNHGRIHGFGVLANGINQKYKNSHVFVRQRAKKISKIICDEKLVTFKATDDSTSSDDEDDAPPLQTTKDQTSNKPEPRKKALSTTAASSQTRTNVLTSTENKINDNDSATKTGQKRSKSREHLSSSQAVTADTSITSSLRTNVTPNTVSKPNVKRPRRNANQMLDPWSWIARKQM